jgi:hypothetical protein
MKVLLLIPSCMYLVACASQTMKPSSTTTTGDNATLHTVNNYSNSIGSFSIVEIIFICILLGMTFSRFLGLSSKNFPVIGWLFKYILLLMWGSFIGILAIKYIF